MKGTLYNVGPSMDQDREERVAGSNKRVNNLPAIPDVKSLIGPRQNYDFLSISRPDVLLLATD